MIFKKLADCLFSYRKHYSETYLDTHTHFFYTHFFYKENL